MSFREKAAKATVSKKITRRKWSKQDFKLVAEAVSACHIQLSSILAIPTYAGIQALKRTLSGCSLFVCYSQQLQLQQLKLIIARINAVNKRRNQKDGKLGTARQRAINKDLEIVWAVAS